MIIQYGLVYDNRQNVVVPPLPKNLGPWNPPAPDQGSEPMDDTPNAIIRHVLYSRDPKQTKDELLGSLAYYMIKDRLRYRHAILIRERVVFLKRARVYAVEFVYAMPDVTSVEYKLWRERQANNGFTRAELQAQRQTEAERFADYHSLRWNPAKHRAKKRARAQAKAQAQMRKTTRCADRSSLWPLQASSL